jgi:1-acyl-sn-glycerol-3-phosphate acyltransferase
MLCIGIKVTSEDIESIDYEQFLGKQYKPDSASTKSGQPACYIANHVSWCDMWALAIVTKGKLAFVASREV